MCRRLVLRPTLPRRFGTLAWSVKPFGLGFPQRQPGKASALPRLILRTGSADKQYALCQTRQINPQSRPSRTNNLVWKWYRQSSDRWEPIHGTGVGQIVFYWHLGKRIS